jgi:hypothetical protein
MYDPLNSFYCLLNTYFSLAPLTGGFSSPNFPASRSFGPQGPSPQGYSSPLNLYNGGQYGLDSISQMLGGDYQSRAFGPQGPSPQGYSSPSNLYNGAQYGSDSLSQMMGGDYPSRSLNNDYWQAARYAPVTRSSTEQRPSAEQRPSTERRTSVVKA